MATLNPFDPHFKLSVCDGPAGAPGVTTPCDFAGLMAQAQFLINAMIILGVLAAVVSFTYAGYLYITGERGKIEHAKDIFRKTGIGLIMMLTAWFIVYQLLSWLASNPGVTALLGSPN
ncbi:hypothetical protein KGQ27_01955 [Patescibacteria group bacterium]|nr:hypothetical protein [Patescibacteria group bacterium]MDE1946318.1 hypothetical protein [Patescibacteria group bacterium]MDE2010770.1 hypothetical protein [Patescibacteria group bacterium]MDE2232655.1 hypothetical protein [Patescibacteria group bacterium]